MTDSDEYLAPIDRVLLPFRLFAKQEAAGGVLLMLCTVVALVWANSAWGDFYHHLWEIDFTVGFKEANITRPLHVWINDGLMAMFFFLVGLEIKREFVAGEFTSLNQAILPIAAAIGGMVFPALVYLIFNYDQPSQQGWGIPMATDIAFALGVLALLGKKVPTSLKVFLTALAIVDDLGAVLVIALFYTSQISLGNLSLGAAFLAVLILGNRLGVRNWIFYAAIGIIGVWSAFLLSGVHPTIAGVLAAFAIPSRSRINSNEFLTDTKEILQDFERPHEDGRVVIGKTRLAALLRLKVAYEDATSPLQRIEKALHPWVALLIMPLFALANAGISFESSFSSVATHPVMLGSVLGLIVGKQIGIMLLCWLVVKFGLCSLPVGINWRHIYGVSWLAGIGFTMSLFIATLAFDGQEYLAVSKMAVLVGSVISGIVGWMVLNSTSGSHLEQADNTVSN